MYWDSEFYVLGLWVQVPRTLSPNTPDSQSKYSGLPVQVPRTPSPSTPDSQLYVLRLLSVSMKVGVRDWYLWIKDGNFGFAEVTPVRKSQNAFEWSKANLVTTEIK